LGGFTKGAKGKEKGALKKTKKGAMGGEPFQREHFLKTPLKKKGSSCAKRGGHTKETPTILRGAKEPLLRRRKNNLFPPPRESPPNFVRGLNKTRAGKLLPL